ncbi:hypothetical protein GALMADRAFT_214806 [Galerina marginata CBS 339.88]|uniref:Uncharacterized protein n=1 Tax=Galerina marginata (strain CBS 339.88) TaxID=685588 RepID=A0A067SGN0_GALM3|nr:hypothetical protein GALMADRAFT_214806 [Galerina marginata CBS 339.88]
MPNLLDCDELGRRLLRWTGSSFVPRYPFFEGPNENTHFSPQASTASLNSLSSSNQDLNRWFNDIELAAQDCDVPVEQYPDVAIYFLRGDLKEVMNQRKDVYLRETRRPFWNWKDFMQDLERVVEEAAKIIASPQISNFASDTMEQLRRAHPYVASSVKLGLIIGGTVVLLPALGLMAWNRHQSRMRQPVSNSPR